MIIRFSPRSLQSDFGFGPTFCSCIEILYASPKPCIRTNKASCNYFALYRGTRQGCPSSPLLCDSLRAPSSSNEEWNRLERIWRGNTHKLSLYPDDLILYLSKADISICKAWEIITKFGKMSYVIKLACPRALYSRSSMLHGSGKVFHLT